MDSVSLLIYDYLRMPYKLSINGLTLYVNKYSEQQRIKQNEIFARLILLQKYLEDREEYEYCHNIKLLMNEYED